MLNEFFEQEGGPIINEDVWDYYEQKEELGFGAYGRVYRVQDYETEVEYAIKQVGVKDNRKLQMEMKIMLEADHDNLVKMHKVYRHANKMYMVLDLVESVDRLPQSDLFEYIMKKGVLNTENACKLVYQTASALQYLNSKNVIHRDLKPENILLGEELFDRVRITDFGLSRIFLDGLSEKMVGTANVGSAGYQAPETFRQGLGDKHAVYGPSVDVWSLGVILHIVVRGGPPFGLAKKFSLSRCKAGEYPSMTVATHKRWGTVPQEIKNLIAQMLIVDPNERIKLQQILDHPFVREQAGIPPAAPVEGNFDLMEALDVDIETVRTMSQ